MSKIWFSESCTYWSDEPIDCCPVCGSLVQTIDSKAWWKRVKKGGVKFEEHMKESMKQCNHEAIQRGFK